MENTFRDRSIPVRQLLLKTYGKKSSQSGHLGMLHEISIVILGTGTGNHDMYLPLKNELLPLLCPHQS